VRSDSFFPGLHSAAKGGEGAGEGDEAAAEEVLEDLQIAWENLESARHIYETAGDKFELARVLIRVGDVSMLNENFPNAITDYEKCLALREEICEPHDERLHQTHTALWEAHGLASSGSDQDHATPYMKHLKLALECMQKCKSQLETDLKAIQAGMEDEQGRTAEQLTDKIGALTESIPDIKETIAAVQEGEQSAQELKSHLANTNAEKAVEPSAEAPVVTTTGFGGFAMPTAGAKEVTTLKPRSKRKAPEGGDGNAAKVAKPADAKKDALASRMGGSSGGTTAGSFTFGGGGPATTTIGF